MPAQSNAIEKVISAYNRKMQRLRDKPIKREIENRINWNNRLIALTGARGVGKTTLLLHHIKNNLPQEKALYVAMDNLYFASGNLLDLAETFVAMGGKYLFLDEVHKYPSWSLEVKNIYDDLPELNTVITGSSILEIYKGQADLSRRAVHYSMHGLSFREFLQLDQGVELSPIPLPELVQRHVEIASDIITDEFRPLKYFKNYLEYGYYPYFKEGIVEYPQKLAQTINLTLETDLPHVHPIQYSNIHKIKLLLSIVADSVPFTPNISKLAGHVGAKWDTLIQFLSYLHDAEIIRMLYDIKKGVNKLNKPNKILLDNPNMAHALSMTQVDVGSIRESFFANQVGHAHDVWFSKVADFVVGTEMLFEVGGKNKGSSQLQGAKQSWVAADNLEIGAHRKVPLWLFGLLY